MMNILDQIMLRIHRTKANGLIVAAALICWGGFSQAFALSFSTQPTDHSVSLGATVTNLVFASGIAPLSYQWRFNDTEIEDATKRTLVLTNVQMANAGGYSVVV